MPPLLYIIFNRPDLTANTFARLRRLQPPILYVAADGPREDRSGEAEICETTRALTEAVDWDCDVTRLYSEQNLGCGRRISSAITEVLRRHESVIIMEDDCVAEPTFFDYCSELLTRFASDDRVMAVSGNNHQRGVSRTPHSYYFSKYPHCWGWGTWRRAWQHFDLSIQAWPSFRDAGGLQTFCHSQRELEYWTQTFDACHAGQIDSWALPYTLCCWMQNGLTVLPDVNLVSNIGFGDHGTHTKSKAPFSDLPTSPIGVLDHPAEVYPHREADAATDDLVYSGPWDFDRRRRKKWFSTRKIKQRLRRAA